MFIYDKATNKSMINNLEFSETKWSLLKQLEKEPLSPKELADLTNTSIANASQQLKLLEAQGFLKKIKNKGTNSRHKRDARILYSLSKQTTWLTQISKEKVERKELKNADTLLLNLLLCDIKNIKQVVKFFLEREDLLKHIQCLYYLHSINQEVHFVIITENLDFFRKENHSFESVFDNKKIIIKFWSHSVNEFEEGLNKKEEYFIDLAKRMTPILCDDEKIKNVLRDWK